MFIISNGFLTKNKPDFLSNYYHFRVLSWYFVISENLKEGRLKEVYFFIGDVLTYNMWD